MQEWRKKHDVSFSITVVVSSPTPILSSGFGTLYLNRTLLYCRQSGENQATLAGEIYMGFAANHIHLQVFFLILFPPILDLFTSLLQSRKPTHLTSLSPSFRVFLLQWLQNLTPQPFLHYLLILLICDLSSFPPLTRQYLLPVLNLISSGLIWIICIPLASDILPRMMEHSLSTIIAGFSARRTTYLLISQSDNEIEAAVQLLDAQPSSSWFFMANLGWRSAVQARDCIIMI